MKIKLILAALLGTHLFATTTERFTVTTIAASSECCPDGAIVINSCPEGQEVCVRVNPGNLRFEVITPATIRPEDSDGFEAGTYTVHVTNRKKQHTTKTVVIPVARYCVDVTSTNAHCACNGSFSTIFNNPQNADVTVTYSAFDSNGNPIGTMGVYTDLCPGQYHWTVQANSNSPVCNQAVVFHDSSTITIGGTGPVVQPTLTPTSQTVPQGGTITFQATPVQSYITYVLHTPGRGLIEQTGNGTFVLDSAQCTDAGGYFVEAVADSCPVLQSTPVTVAIGGTCDLSVTLTPTTGCSTTSAGSIAVTFAGGSGSVNYFVNGMQQPGPIRSPFTIQNLAVGNYEIQLVDAQNPSCTTEATTAVKAFVPPAPELTFSASCTGQPLVFTVTPPVAGPFEFFTLFFPDGTSQTQINNIFTITNATEEENGNYSANYTDANGCVSARSTIVPVTIQSGVIALLSPTVQVVPQFGTITLTLAPADPTFIYQIQTPNPNRGVKGVLTQVGNPTFTITAATQEDIGTYFGLINAQGCVSPLSNTVTVTLGGTCDLSLGLTAVPACSASGQGSIIGSFTGGSGTVNYSLNGVAQPGPVQSPFTIPNLAPNTFYTVSVTDVSLTNCTNTASLLLTAEAIPASPVLTATSTCEGEP